MGRNEHTSVARYSLVSYPDEKMGENLSRYTYLLAGAYEPLRRAHKFLLLVEVLMFKL